MTIDDQRPVEPILDDPVRPALPAADRVQLPETLDLVPRVLRRVGHHEGARLDDLVIGVGPAAGVVRVPLEPGFRAAVVAADGPLLRDIGEVDHQFGPVDHQGVLQRQRDDTAALARDINELVVQGQMGPRGADPMVVGRREDMKHVGMIADAGAGPIRALFDPIREVDRVAGREVEPSRAAGRHRPDGPMPLQGMRTGAARAGIGGDGHGGRVEPAATRQVSIFESFDQQGRRLRPGAGRAGRAALRANGGERHHGEQQRAAHQDRDSGSRHRLAHPETLPPAAIAGNRVQGGCRFRIQRRPGGAHVPQRRGGRLAGAREKRANGGGGSGRTRRDGGRHRRDDSAEPDLRGESAVFPRGPVGYAKLARACPRLVS